MTYRALTIDTNVLFKRIFSFEKGLLRELAQFKNADTKFVLSEMVRGELLRHAEKQAREAHAGFAAAALEAEEKGLLLPAAAGLLTARLVDPAAVARTRIDKFMEMTGGVLIENALAEIDEVTRRYFAVEPPFEEAKKEEFPDAIAVLAIEAWARFNGRVLVVSRDAGWQAFGETSEHLDVVDNLRDALSRLQAQAEALTHKVSKIFERMVDAGMTDPFSAFSRRLEYQLEELNPDIEATSRHYYEAELTGVTIDGWNLVPKDTADSDFRISIVRHDDDETVFTIPIQASISIHATFSLQHWDNVDREYVSMGRLNDRVTLDFVDDAIVTLRGSLDDPDNLILDEVELSSPVAVVDFGDLDMAEERRALLRVATLSLID